ncbi:MAG: SpoIIE family protein phosphatase [Clostridiales bacterium]|nr:SpoIIE family protein phosphatase [Clostridiales bacterium]
MIIRKRKSIRQWITLCFTLTFVFSLLAMSAMNYRETSSNNVKQSTEWAESCMDITWYLLDQWGVDTIYDPQIDPSYWIRRDMLYALCKNFSMDYLYVYTIDPETQVRTYIFCVGGTPEKDNDVLEARIYGAVSKDPLDEMETAVLSGSRELQQGTLSNQFGDEMTWIMPYVDRHGVLRAIIGVDDDTRVTREKIQKEFYLDIVPVILSLLMGFFILMMLVRHRILSPVRAISDSMKRFAQNSRQKPEPLHIRPGDEIGEIAAAFEKMTEDISDYINNNERLTRERVETNVQLEIARRIQTGLVPQKKDHRGSSFMISAMNRQAKDVGGDFYDCFPLDENRFCVVIGDVSGKGISGAMFMAVVRTMIREKLISGLNPSEALNQTNRELCAENPENLFVTVFAGVLNLQSGELRFANAGHTYPLLLNGDPSLLRPYAGIALGLFEDADIRDETLILSPGHGIVLYTDGVTEAVSPDRGFFGEERLLETFRSDRAAADTAEKAVRLIDGAVESFCRGTDASDDLTVLALFYTGSEKEPDWKPLPVDLASFDTVKKAVLGLMKNTPRVRQCLLACDEALTNIIRYSNAAAIFFDCAKEDGCLRVSFRDNGIPFDPTACGPTEKDPDMLDSGGMGLNMIRQIASAMRYERRDDENIFSMEFRMDE